jgi:hypothetical protein
VAYWFKVEDAAGRVSLVPAADGRSEAEARRRDVQAELGKARRRTTSRIVIGNQGFDASSVLRVTWIDHDEAERLAG